jgi:hypothetical protein
MEAEELIAEFSKGFSHSTMDLYRIKLKACPNYAGNKAAQTFQFFSPKNPYTKLI